MLKICQLNFEHFIDYKLDASELSGNNLIRCLVIDSWYWFDLDSLSHQLPNLSRFETKFEPSSNSGILSIKPHLSIKHLRVTLSDPFHDLEKLLKLTPNLHRLRVRGNLRRNPLINYFKTLADVFPILVPLLQYFDCELYCYSIDGQEYEAIIKQLHTLFNRIRCLSGRGHNQCYATDITIYPTNNEYEGKDRLMISKNSFTLLESI